MTATSPPPVNSFDVFDTLIARRCIQPGRIFDLVEIKSGRAGFGALRRRAESNVRHLPHTIDSIYAEFIRLTGLAPEDAEALKAAELETEIENSIPIAENIVRVRDGDILLSDMYLHEDIIRRLLQKAGLDKKTRLIVTNAGKRSGEIWTQLMMHTPIALHIGDNAHSDVAMPERFGIRAAHSGAATMTETESRLFTSGLRDLTQLVREARLITWDADPAARAAQRAGIEIHFPLRVLEAVAQARKTGEKALRVDFPKEEARIEVRQGFNAAVDLLKTAPLAETLALDENALKETAAHFRSRLP